jgi:hypothetical protein
VCYESGFKYPASDINRRDVEYERRRHYISHSYTRDCDRDSSDYYYDQCSGAILRFFRDRKREHYDELNNNVFVWLKDLKLNINNAYITYNFHPIRGRVIDDGLSPDDILTNNIDIPIMNHVRSHRGFKVESIINCCNYTNR